MSEERNGSLRKFALRRNCVTPKSSRLWGSPQTPLSDNVTNPFTLLHEDIHQPFCSPKTYYRAIFSYDSPRENLQGISEEEDNETSPKRQFPPFATIWSPEQQAMLCPVNIDDQEVARQAKAEARALFVCSCSSNSALRSCHLHTIEVAHQAKLNLFWRAPSGPPGLQSPASASPPSSHLRRLQALAAASSRLNIDDDDVSPITSRSSLVAEKQSTDLCNSVGVQTDFTLPPHLISQAEFLCAYQSSISNNPPYPSFHNGVHSGDNCGIVPPANNCVGSGRIDWSPSQVRRTNCLSDNFGHSDDVISVGGEWRRRRSRQARDDGALTPRRPSAVGTTPVISIQRRSFGELDLSPIRGDWAPPTGDINQVKCEQQEEFAALDSPTADMSVDDRSQPLSPIGFIDGDVMSSTYYPDCIHGPTADLGDKISGTALDLDTGYQSMAVSTNCNSTR